MKTVLGLSRIALLVVLIWRLSAEAHCQTIGYALTGPDMSGHPQNAHVVELSNGGAATTATGDRTSNFPTPPAPEPLGTTARRLKAEHNQPKAKVTYVNQ